MTFSNHMPWRLKLLILRCLRAIATGKKKNDKLDAKKIADLLRCDLLPECYMAPTEIRELLPTIDLQRFTFRAYLNRKYAHGKDTLNWKITERIRMEFKGGLNGI